MKRLMLYLLTLLSNVVYSQDFEIIKEGNRWVSSYYSEDPSSFTTCGGVEEFYFLGDTVIGDSTYAILWIKVWNEYCSGPNANYNYSYDDPMPELFGLYYENRLEKKIFMLPNDYASDFCDEGLILIWDELLEVGDTSSTYIPSYGCVKFMVDSIVNSLDSLAPRRKHYISGVDNHFVINSRTFFLEGIGPVNDFGGGFIHGFNNYVPDYNRQYSLDCFYQDSVKVLGGDCILDKTTSINGYRELNGFVIYPNPVRDKVFVSGGGIFDIKIINIWGTLIYQKLRVSGDLEIDLGNFHNGIYLAIISQDNSNKTITKRVVIDK